MRAETVVGMRDSVSRRYAELHRVLDGKLGLEPDVDARAAIPPIAQCHGLPGTAIASPRVQRSLWPRCREPAGACGASASRR
jgi:hypothetical protein